MRGALEIQKPSKQPRKPQDNALLRYNESMNDFLRPKEHYTTKDNWLNDPNGLLYHAGIWHLFYQTNPRGSGWGNMSWGHATSMDLLNWTELPIAIPHLGEEAVFSGSAVVDTQNTAGFAQEGETAFVAIYTADTPGNQSQALAYSVDEGLTWTRYEGNPVLDIGSDQFRDPKVFWYGTKKDGHWVMAVVEAKKRRVAFYTSPDLKEWTLSDRFGPAHAVEGNWECPDLFPLNVDGEEKWVLLVSLNRDTIAGGSGTQYFIGDFDGESFVAENIIDSDDLADYDWLDYGPDFYAGVTWNNAPRGRRVLIAWANDWAYGTRTPTSPWRGAMSFARELTLERGAEDKVHLVSTPILPEVAAEGIIRKRYKVARDAVGTIELRSEAGDVFSMEFRDGRVFFDRSKSGKVSFSDRYILTWEAPLPEGENAFELLIVADGSIVEVYIDGGRLTSVAQAFPSAPWKSITRKRK